MDFPVGCHSGKSRGLIANISTLHFVFYDILRPDGLSDSKSEEAAANCRNFDQAFALARSWESV